MCDVAGSEEVIWVNGNWNAVTAAGGESPPSYPRLPMIPAAKHSHFVRIAADRILKSRQKVIQQNRPKLGRLYTFDNFVLLAPYLESSAKTALDIVFQRL